MELYLERPAIEVSQPFQKFYVCAIKARKLLEIAFTEPIRYDKDGNLIGTQRPLDEERRVKEIKEFVEGVDAAFPNSIILSANWDSDGLNCIDHSLRWRFENGKLIIPTNTKLASVIDGQHRLYGFKDANESALDMELVCSIYIDLPNALQAYLFATINSTQKKVDRSLAYEQFGYNIDFEEPKSWSPDKLAIALYKKFNTESGPFFRHIKMAPQIDDLLALEIKESGWAVSTATIVDGILRLISSNPKKDKYYLQQKNINERNRKILASVPDKSPLRQLFLNIEDIVIYTIIKNFFEAAFEVLDLKNKNKVTIIKTIGIQGLFDALKKIIEVDIKKANNHINDVNFKKDYYKTFFNKIKDVDFSTDFYAQFSNVGRTQISDTLLIANDYVKIIEKEDLKDTDIRKNEYITKIKTYINPKTS